MITNKENSAHYVWGDKCDAWTLLQSENGIIKEECMPSNTEEQLHYHNETEQFFYILEGVATFFLDGKEIQVSGNEGIGIKAKQAHKICNKSAGPLRFLVVSIPGNPVDRVNI
ncbi:cupin domain-containing protein [Sinomicrobium soli]|uniref:cupin domain-containing protein n=1 Tax=Sinomicrobium sp. N-1-3-6 TaxID=2219864 RepID=UPI000DCB9AD2|nr:cupin domain-containing protein [Sinomicrobium sp. N-1-3-6]RAV28695.1 cupin domain-containing protein [Sinomicrobium sp. N-1-3-6]